MTINGVNIHKVKMCYLKGHTNLEDFNEIEKEMKEQNINTNKIDILNITTVIADSGSCEIEHDRYEEISNISVKYDYLVYYMEH